jgi:hypothetical protein
VIVPEFTTLKPDAATYFKTTRNDFLMAFICTENKVSRHLGKVANKLKCVFLQPETNS